MAHHTNPKPQTLSAGTQLLRALATTMHLPPLPHARLHRARYLHTRRIDVPPLAQAAAHAAAEAAAIADNNAKATAIFISGATGPCAAAINGLYSPTQERGLDGRIVYGKIGNASMCIEHLGGLWQVKPVSQMGKDTCAASLNGGCALEACTSHLWYESDGRKLCVQLGLMMVTGVEADLEVSAPLHRRTTQTPSPKPQTPHSQPPTPNPASHYYFAPFFPLLTCMTLTPSPLRRLLHMLLRMLLLKHALLLTTTQKLPPSLSAAFQVPTLQPSMDCTHLRKREGWTGALFTARSAMPQCASNTSEACGKSNPYHKWARTISTPLSVVDVLWRLAPHDYGGRVVVKRPQYTVTALARVSITQHTTVEVFLPVAFTMTAVQQARFYNGLTIGIKLAAGSVTQITCVCARECI